MTFPIQIRPHPSLVLASSSPRRRDLLKLMGLVFEISGSHIPEQALPGESAPEFTRRMASEKARSVSQKFIDAWILGADTVVVLDTWIMGSPASEQEARQMLEALSGRTHSVFTSFCLYRVPTQECVMRTIESNVLFKDLNSDEISGYIRSGEPFDKAGGYAAQGLGSFMIREIHGSYTNVVGLPLCEVIEAMKELKIIQKFPG